MRSTRVLAAGLTAAFLATGAAQAATPEESTTNRLQDRREVAAGQRSYVVGFQDGNFYANGWHITGEMGGVWAPPLKLVDGVWFRVDGTWTGPATKFSSGWGYTRFDLPDSPSGLKLERTDFAPDAHRAGVFALKLTNPTGSDVTSTIDVDAHSELMGAYPWGFSGVKPNAADNLPDHGSYEDGALKFTDAGTLPDGAPHDYTAYVAASETPTAHEVADTGGTFRGNQGDTKCDASSQAPPSGCDDGPFGNGTGGRLTYQVTVPANGSKTLWVAVAGSDKSAADARAQLTGALDDPAGQLAAKVASREAIGARTKVDLPGDRLLEKAIEWGKQNLADADQSATGLQIRWTDQGKQFPAPSGTVDHARWFAAGYPDYPWIFATDGEYTAFAAAALGQFETAKAHLITLRDISEALNGDSGIVVHESVSDGSIWFGHNSRHTNADGTTSYDFNTDETVKFPSAVALLWRWTGDDAFRDELYPFAVRNLKVIEETLDADHDGWPEGLGNVERSGMGEEKLDNAVYYLRGLVDLADMAQSKGDKATYKWARKEARLLRRGFERAWWSQTDHQYVDSLRDPGDQQLFQKHWISQTPMEAELTRGTTVTPGIATREHGVEALAERENDCYSGSRPGSLGLFHTGCGGGPEGKGEFSIFSLTTSIQAVGEGNYGRLGDGQQRRYTDANAETMFSEPATGGTPDEQPGAMPEIFPSGYKGDLTTGFTPNIDRCWTCRSMVMQAWGNYGTAWSVVHQQLGVRPFVNRGVVEVVPQVPDGQPSVAGSDIRLGEDGSVDVAASRAGSVWTTKVDGSDVPGRRLVIGATLPFGSKVGKVTLDGSKVHPDVRVTNRGVEVTVATEPGAIHTLVVTAR